MDLTGTRFDAPLAVAAMVVARLEEAGMTLLAMPNGGHSTALRVQQLPIFHDLDDVRDWADESPRVPRPEGGAITRMDEAWTWLGLIPANRVAWRRIVAMRALVSPATERHLFSWRRIGRLIGVDDHTVKAWHSNGIGAISQKMVFPPISTSQIPHSGP